MASSLSRIAQADVDALATLANSKLSPATPYAFAPFAGDTTIALPTDFAPVATYGSGSFLEASKVTLRVYGYKTIGGKKTYTSYFQRIVFTGETGMGSFSLTWTWTSPAGPLAPEGYIVVIPRGAGSTWDYQWQDIGLVNTFTASGVFTGDWKIDNTLDDLPTAGTQENLPCGHGAWLKVMNRIRKGFFSKMDLFGGSEITFTDDFLLSGPWCVSVAQKCYLYLTGKPIYKDLNFLYSESDSSTGNQFAAETDMLAFYFNAVGVRPNNLDFSIPGTINGRISFYSNPPGQSLSDWTITTTPTSGITLSFNSHYIDSDQGSREVTAFFFDLVNVPYAVGTPIVITFTPPTGLNIIGDGTGGRLDIVLTGEFSTLPATDTTIIHSAGASGKSVALDNTLPDTTFSDPETTSHDFPAHWRSQVDGVFMANTLPTMGEMMFLDVDLPNYSPNREGPTSSRRVARNDDLAYMPVVENKSALWPIFPESDFTPDSVKGKAVQGSKVWQMLGTKKVDTSSFDGDVPPGGATPDLYIMASFFVSDGTADLRVLNSAPGLTLYVRKGTPPTAAVFDATATADDWFSLAAAIPGFGTDDFYYFSVLNPGSEDVANTLTGVTIADAAAPNGTFFPTSEDDDGNDQPLKEGVSYHLSDPAAFDARPIPMLGYCVKSITLMRAPGAAITADLPVKIGLMTGFGFDTAGVFEQLLDLAIPAGSTSLIVTTFLPVCSGTFLAFQCAETISVQPAVNFQPIMHSTFSPRTAKFGGSDIVVGEYAGVPWYNSSRALLFFNGGLTESPILLPLAASIYNDLLAALGLLP